MSIRAGTAPVGLTYSWLLALVLLRTILGLPLRATPTGYRLADINFHGYRLGTCRSYGGDRHGVCLLFSDELRSSMLGSLHVLQRTKVRARH